MDVWRSCASWCVGKRRKNRHSQVGCALAIVASSRARRGLQHGIGASWMPVLSSLLFGWQYGGSCHSAGLPSDDACCVLFGINRYCMNCLCPSCNCVATSRHIHHCRTQWNNRHRRSRRRSHLRSQNNRDHCTRADRRANHPNKPGRSQSRKLALVEPGGECPPLAHIQAPNRNHP